MHPNEDLLQTFYTSFQKRDAQQMVSCYHPDVVFSDPIFQDLRGQKAGVMWRMLCERGTDLDVEFRDVRADDATGSAHWEARYTFTKTGRKVHNIIDATFQFRDGKIIRHTDSFDLPAWARQALGLPGRLLGGTGFLQKKIRAMGAAELNKFAAASQ